MTQSGRKRSLVGIISVFVILGLFGVLMLHYSSKAMTGVKGYLSGESHWSKAQKQSILELIRYVDQRDEQYYRNFLESLTVIQGDKQGRLTLSSDDPDYQLAYEGFLQGRNHPDEINEMIWLFVNFQDNPYLARPIAAWEEGDRLMEEVERLGEDIHAKIQNEELTDEERRSYLNMLYELDDELTGLEKEFIDSMTEAGRWVSKLIFWFGMVAGLTLVLGACVVTVFVFRRINRLSEDVQVSEARFRNVLDSSRDVIYQMDPEGTRYEFMSLSVENMLGYKLEEILKGGPEFIFEKMHPDDVREIRNQLEKFSTDDLEELLEQDNEFRVKTRSGEYIWVNNRRSLLKDEEGNPIGIVGNVRDISERKKYIEQIDKSLQEKDVLLAEIHHRVKNNLAIISSLIELQKAESDESVLDSFQEIQSRIKSIALVHEKLYKSETFSEVSLSEYIEELTDIIASTFKSTNQSVRIVKNLESVRMSIISAVPLGLVYNELINNVYKHAFSDLDSGEVQVDLKRLNGDAELRVADNGVGLPDDFDMNRSGTLGMTLIKTLTKQLNGEINVDREDGWTVFRLRFQIEKGK